MLTFGCHTHIYKEVSAHTHTHTAVRPHTYTQSDCTTHTYMHVNVHLTHTQLIKEILLKSLTSAYPVN